MVEMLGARLLRLGNFFFRVVSGGLFSFRPAAVSPTPLRSPSRPCTHPNHPNTIKQAGPAVPTGRWRLRVAMRGPMVVSHDPCESDGCVARPVRIVARPVRIAGRGCGYAASNGSDGPCGSRLERHSPLPLCRGPLPTPPRPREPPKRNQTSMAI